MLEVLQIFEDVDEISSHARRWPERAVLLLCGALLVVLVANLLLVFRFLLGVYHALLDEFVEEV